jgi:catechol 2,3-dioxygenase-like lactoylglutathione lyase family enzyme
MRIRELELSTADLTAQAAFWNETLGVRTTVAADAVTVRLRESSIRFEPAEAGADARYHFAINIPRGRIEDAARWIAERHELLAFHGDPDVEEGATIVHTDRGAATLYFLDGGGNVCELIASDHLRNESDEPFGPQLLLEIAEIGIAAADTGATSRAVQEALGAGVLWGGRPGWKLTAIGDDHGVVIVAPLGRGWIPVGLPAVPLPTTIVADGPEHREVTLPEGPYRIRAAPPGAADARG